MIHSAREPPWRCGASLFWRLLQPDVHAGGVPVVGFVKYIHAAVAIEVRDAGFVEAVAGGENGFAKMALAVAVKDECLGVGVVGLRLSFRTFGHFSGEDVEV